MGDLRKDFNESSYVVSNRSIIETSLLAGLPIAETFMLVVPSADFTVKTSKNLHVSSQSLSFHEILSDACRFDQPAMAGMQSLANKSFTNAANFKATLNPVWVNWTADIAGFGGSSDKGIVIHLKSSDFANELAKRSKNLDVKEALGMFYLAAYFNTELAINIFYNWVRFSEEKEDNIELAVVTQINTLFQDTIDKTLVHRINAVPARNEYFLVRAVNPSWSLYLAHNTVPRNLFSAAFNETPSSEVADFAAGITMRSEE